MREDRKQKLLDILQDADSWVSGSSLSHALGVSNRTVRTYVSQLSKGHEIESSKLGYRLSHRGLSTAEGTPATAPSESTVSSRSLYVLSRLLSSKEAVSLFELADDMGLGESTLTNSVLPAVRQTSQAHGVEVRNHDWCLSLEGPERAKRKLLGYVASRGSYGYFSSKQALSEMFPNVDTEAVLGSLVTIFQDSGLFLNAYALNNLLVHMLIIAIRLASGNNLESGNETLRTKELIGRVPQRNQVAQCVARIAEAFEDAFGRTISQRDLNQVALLITLSTNPVTTTAFNQDSIASFVGETFFNDIHEGAERLADRYGLVPFDGDFIAQLALHSYNACQRALFGVCCPNPIGEQIKQEYPLIYDMAVYFAHRLQSAYDVGLSEDEIAFIAFHIGAYIERTKEPDGLVRAIVVAERYHDFASQLVGSLERSFPDELRIVSVLSYDEYLSLLPPCELLIATIDPPTHHPHKVIVGPIVGKADIRRVRDALDQIDEERTSERAARFLKGLIKPELFVRNLVCDSAEGYITSLGALCIRNGYVDERFIEDVKLREHVSSTAFTNFLAVPHPISQSARKSFICALHNDTPITWSNDRSVNIVLMIGLAQQDLKCFPQAFNIIIDRFGSTDCAMRIMATGNFDEFVDAIVNGSAGSVAY